MVEASTNFAEEDLGRKGYQLIKDVYLLLDDGDQRFLGQYDLTQVQFYALLWLEEDAKSMKELSRHLLCDPSNVTRVATILERKSLIKRRRDPQDRRIVRLSLTDAGRRLCQEVRHAHDTYIQRRMTVLSHDEHAALHALLHKLSGGLRQQLDTLP